MLTFNQLNHLNVLLPQLVKTSFGVSRSDMPQIFGKNYQDFRDWLAGQEVTCFEKEIVPSQYKATQCEFNKEKITKMFRDSYISEHGSNPIFVSVDGYILDGHHRWICHWIQDDRPLRAIEIPLNVDQCLTFMRKYDKVGFKSVKEQVLNA